MTSSSARFEDLQRKYEENPRRFFAPLANELRRSGNARRAAEICREYLAHLPEHLSGHVVLAQSLADLGDRSEARAAFERVLALDPENVVALRALGDMDAQVGERDQARGWYERLLQVDPRDGEVTTRLATLELPVVPETASPAAPGVADARDEYADARPSGATLAGDAADWSFAPSAAEGLVDASHDEAVGAADAPAPSAAARTMRDDEDAEEFTAGFFASVLEPGQPRAGEVPTVDLDAALARPVGAEPDLAPADIDRLLSDLPALGEEPPRSSDVEASLTPWGRLPGADATVAPTEPLGVDSALSPTFDDLTAPTEEPAAPLGAAAEPVPEPLREDDDEDRAAAFGVSAGEPEAPAPFVTETMATLYLQQGHRAQALQMYEQLVRESPADDALRRRYEALREAELAVGGTPVADASATEVATTASDAGERREGGAQTAAAIVAGAAFAAGVVYTVSGWLRTLVQGEQSDAVAEAASAGSTSTAATAGEGPALDAAVVEPATVAVSAPEGPRDELPAFGDEAEAAAGLGAEPADAAWTGELHAAPASELDEIGTAMAADDVDLGMHPEWGADALASGDSDAPMFAPEAGAPIRADADPAVEAAPADEPRVAAASADAWEPAGVAEAASGNMDEAEPMPPVAEVLDEPWIASDDSAISVADDAAAEATADGEFELVTDEALVVADVEPDGAADAMPPTAGGVVAPEIEEAELVDVGTTALPAAEWEAPEEAPAVAEVEAASVVDGHDVGDDPFAFDVVEPEPGVDAESANDSEYVASTQPAAAHSADDPFAWGEQVAEPALATAERADLWTTVDLEPISLERLSGRPVSHADEVAAGALAAAAVSLQNDAALDAQLREASLDDPTSLELLLRAGGHPSRPNAGFSFDQFFQADPSRRPADVAAPVGHDDASGRRTSEDDDREHFHAWLAGLSDS